MTHAADDLWTGTDVCTCTVFGRPLADMSDADSDCMRIHLAVLDDCPDCTVWARRYPAFAALKTITRTERV